MKKIVYIIILCGIVTSCHTESVVDNTAPATPNLIFPANNQLCTDKTLQMEWSASVDEEGGAVSYLLQVATDAVFTRVFHESTVTQTTKELTFETNEAYFWRVKALDTQEASSDFTEVYRFYSEGEGTENHVPFSAVLVGPLEQSSVASGTVKLEWIATDLDQDILSYDVFLGTSQNNLQNVVMDSNDSFYTITVLSNVTYYWKVNVKDVNDTTIGQVWEFTTL